MTATEDYNLHRQHRTVIGPFLSVASVGKLETVIRRHTEKVLTRLEQTSEPVEINQLLKANAHDAVVLYAFGDCLHLLEDAEYGKPHFKAPTCVLSLNPLCRRLIFIG